MQYDDTVRKVMEFELKGTTYTLKTLTIHHYGLLVRFVREKLRESFNEHLQNLNPHIMTVDEETARLLMESLVDRFLSPVSLFSSIYFKVMGTPEGIIEWFYQSAIESHPGLDRAKLSAVMDNADIRRIRQTLNDLLKTETERAEELKKDSPDTLTPESVK